MVERGTLLRCCMRKRTEGSNPSLSESKTMSFFKKIKTTLNKPISKNKEKEEQVKKTLFGMSMGLAIFFLIVFVLVPMLILLLVLGWLQMAGF